AAGRDGPTVVPEVRPHRVRPRACGAEAVRAAKRSARSSVRRLLAPGATMGRRTVGNLTSRRRGFARARLSPMLLAGYFMRARIIAQDFAASARRVEPEWWTHCGGDKRSDRRTAPARAAAS